MSGERNDVKKKKKKKKNNVRNDADDGLSIIRSNSEYMGHD